MLHPNTLRPVTAAGVPVWIRNSFAPEKPGTKITAERKSSGGVKALTAIRDVTMITVGGPGIVGLTDVLARSFAATAATRTNVLFVSQSSSQNDICFVMPTADEKRTVAALREAFAPEIAEQTVEHVSADRNVAIVAVVGENMRGIPGIAGTRVRRARPRRHQHHRHRQGSSEYNISWWSKHPQCSAPSARYMPNSAWDKKCSAEPRYYWWQPPNSLGGGAL